MTDITGKTLADALGIELTTALGQAFGVSATSSAVAGSPSAATGWTISMTVAGVTRGTATIWVDNAGFTHALQQARQLPAEPDAAVVSAALHDATIAATKALDTTAPFNMLVFAAPVIEPGGPTSTGAVLLDVDLAALGTFRVAIHADLVAPAQPASARLDAVLDVELPLVVRFGQATMPLRVLAGLATGSIVDMHRSPDEPVELLIGDRVIARGDVVTIAGNYGVRITELVNAARPIAALLEA